MSADTNAKKIVVGITGASGSVYARALIESLLAARAHTSIIVAAVVSSTAPEVWRCEIGGEIRDFLASRDVPVFEGRDYSAPFASGSARWGAMVVVPCSMSTTAKIAHGLSDDLLSRAADVMIKERRTLVIVPRETPLSTIHLENLLAVARAGATVMPAAPSFYMRPTSVDEVVQTVVTRVLDHLGVEVSAKRWGDGAAPLSRTSGGAR
jgi:4-hydroxy-3-polyprenylbenzoate decarboxylase